MVEIQDARSRTIGGSRDSSRWPQMSTIGSAKGILKHSLDENVATERP